MRAVLLIRSPEEAPDRLQRLQAAGWQAQAWSAVTPAVIREWAALAPDAILIDLARRPSHGKEVAQACRERKALRVVPLVFLEGDTDNVERFRERFPEAVFGSWSKLRSALRQAVAQKGKLPAAPPAHVVYSTPLPKKLGIRENSIVLLLDAPVDLPKILGQLPSGARLELDAAGLADVVLQFVRSRDSLIAALPHAVRALSAKGKLWIAYPKRSAGIATDLTQEFLREYALTQALVDYKICSIDATWTGFCFSRRKA